MLPATLQFIIAMVACSINERLQRKLDYAQEEVRVPKEDLRSLGHRPILSRLTIDDSLPWRARS